METDLNQCMDCGTGGYNAYELKEGLCSDCYGKDLYYCTICFAMFEDECICGEWWDD